MKLKVPCSCWVLFLIFLILKLTSVISWSWWLVTLPLWGPTALFLGIAALFFGIAIVIAVVFIIFGIMVLTLAIIFGN